MRALLVVLGVVGLVIVVAGAVNHTVRVRVDYLVGTSTAVSLFWFAVAVAVLIVAAGLLGVLIGRSAVSGDRRKLETELEDTYRRLREAQAAARPAAVEASNAKPTAVEAPAAEASPDRPETTVARPTSEPSTVVVPAPAEPRTVVGAPPAEEQTVVAAPPAEEQPATGEAAAPAAEEGAGPSPAEGPSASGPPASPA